MLKKLAKVFDWLFTSDYKIIHEASGRHPDSAFALFGSLKANGIRCNLRTLGAASVRYTGNAGLTYRVEVHEEDLYKARAIMAESLRKTGR